MSSLLACALSFFCTCTSQFTISMLDASFRTDSIILNSFRCDCLTYCLNECGIRRDPVLYLQFRSFPQSLLPSLLMTLFKHIQILFGMFSSPISFSSFFLRFSCPCIRFADGLHFIHMLTILPYTCTFHKHYISSMTGEYMYSLGICHILHGFRCCCCCCVSDCKKVKESRIHFDFRLLRLFRSEYFLDSHIADKFSFIHL